MNYGWENVIEPPLKGRKCKPRQSGITMLIDKGLTVHETTELLSLNAPYIDFIKLTFGTAVLYPQQTLIEKIQIAKNFKVAIYPGGTLFEIALGQGKQEEYFQFLLELGIDWVEISDGTLEVSMEERQLAIKKAIDLGLKVITEIGKKDIDCQPNEEILATTALLDLEAGAKWVIVEGRESGKGIGIYDNQGTVIIDKLGRLNDQIGNQAIIWEAPLKPQQALLINEFGPNVNLGNIPPGEIMALEALRLGYRSDTWKQ